MLSFKNILFVLIMFSSLLHAEEQCLYNVFSDKTELSIRNDVIESVATAHLKHITTEKDTTEQFVLKVSTQFADYKFFYYVNDKKLMLYVSEIYNYGKSRINGSYQEGKFISKRIEEVLPPQKITLNIKKHNIEVAKLNQSRLNKLLKDIDIFNDYLVQSKKNESCKDW